MSWLRTIARKRTGRHPRRDAVGGYCGGRGGSRFGLSTEPCGQVERLSRAVAIVLPVELEELMGVGILGVRGPYSWLTSRQRLALTKSSGKEVLPANAPGHDGEQKPIPGGTVSR